MRNSLIQYSISLGLWCTVMGRGPFASKFPVMHNSITTESHSSSTKDLIELTQGFFHTLVNKRHALGLATVK